MFEKRSKQSQVQDLIRMAPIAPNLEAYLKYSNKFDFPNVDTPDPKLIFSHKTRREQAADIAKLATRAPVEVWIKDTSQHDIENVDTPKSKRKETVKEKIIRKFRVEKKDKAEKDAKKAKEEPKEKQLDKPAEKTELKAEEKDATSPLTEEHKMPSKAEILEKAQQLYMADNGRFQDLVGTPEESELREEGYLKRAQFELLTSTDTKASRQVMDYVGTLKNELEQIGFTIVPIEGFTL